MNKSGDLKPIEIGYGDEKVIFHLGIISIAQEEEMNNKFADISDSAERHKKEFELCREALGEFSRRMPEKLVREKGELKRIPLSDKAETAAGAIEEYFAERTPSAERIIRDAYFLFKRQLAPDARFLDSSA